MAGHVRRGLAADNGLAWRNRDRIGDQHARGLRAVQRNGALMFGDLDEDPAVHGGAEAVLIGPVVWASGRGGTIQRPFSDTSQGAAAHEFRHDLEQILFDEVDILLN